jgi:DNA-binding transcriptional regulator YdaS (Cro superfamily)
MELLVNRAIAACGGLTSLANSMAVPPQVVVNWRARGVPLAHCAELETVTGGAVRRWEMRPDDWHKVWPELIGTDGAPAVPVPA